MAHFEDLPGELLARIIGFADKTSLAQLRLVNKRLEQISVQQLFAKITLYAQWEKESPYSEGDQMGWSDDGINEYCIDGDEVTENSISDDERETDHVALASHERMPTIAGRRRADDPNANEDSPSSSVSPSRSPVGERRWHSTVPSRYSSPPRRRQVSSSSPPHRHVDSPPVERRRARTFLSGDSDSLKDTKEDLNESEVASCRILPSPPYDARMFKSILQNDTLKRYVREVQIYTCNIDCDFHSAYADERDRANMQSPEFDPIYVECVERLGELSNMRKLTVHFDRHSGGFNITRDVFQNYYFQLEWLSKIFRSVKAGSQAIELAIRHHDSYMWPINTSTSMGEIVARMTKLRLSIKHEETNRLDVGSTYRCGGIHLFWNVFSAHFLDPAQQRLTTLVLYSDLPLGWFPTLDLRKIHFPKLRSLTLGQHMFHAAHQVEWIISHKSTLNELYLDCCSILYQIGHAITGWLDAEGYPKENGNSYGWSSGPEHVQDDAEFSRTCRFVSISLCWHEIFTQFTEELHVLKVFRFGSSNQWRMDTESRFIKQGCQTRGLPIMPWEDEENIENQILETRYMIWDDFEQNYRPRWTSDAGVYNNDTSADRFWRDEWKAKFASYPDCKEADEAALQTLLEKIKGK